MPAQTGSQDLARVRCIHAADCPACPNIRDVYAKQLRNKWLEALEVLKRGLGPSAADSLVKACLPMIPSPRIEAYRTSAKLCLHEDNLGQKAIGIYRQNTHRVLGIPQCRVHHPAIQEVMQHFSRHAGEQPFYAHQRRSFQTDKLKFLTVRCNVQGTGIGMIISHTGMNLPDLKRWLASFAPKNWAIYQCALRPEDGNAVVNPKVQHLLGPKTFPYSILDLEWDLTPSSFMQANAYLLDQLVSAVCEGLQGETLLDLYGGFGGYSFHLQQKFGKIHVVDANAEAIAIGQQLCQQRGWTNIAGSAISVERSLQAWSKNPKRQDITHIIVNPPRLGLSPEVCQHLGRKHFPNLKSLTYVSCNPEALSRDLKKLLTDKSCKIESIKIFDMFPQTQHAEVLAKLSF